MAEQIATLKGELAVLSDDAAVVPLIIGDEQLRSPYTWGWAVFWSIVTISAITAGFWVFGVI